MGQWRKRLGDEFRFHFRSCELSCVKKPVLRLPRNINALSGAEKFFSCFTEPKRIQQCGDQMTVARADHRAPGSTKLVNLPYGLNWERAYNPRSTYPPRISTGSRNCQPPFSFRRWNRCQKPETVFPACRTKRIHH